MVTIIKYNIGDCNFHNCFMHANGLTNLAEISNLDFLSDDTLNTNETPILKNKTGYL